MPETYQKFPSLTRCSSLFVLTQNILIKLRNPPRNWVRNFKTECVNMRKLWILIKLTIDISPHISLSYDHWRTAHWAAARHICICISALSEDDCGHESLSVRNNGYWSSWITSSQFNGCFPDLLKSRRIWPTLVKSEISLADTLSGSKVTVYI